MQKVHQRSAGDKETRISACQTRAINFLAARGGVGALPRPRSRAPLPHSRDTVRNRIRSRKQPREENGDEELLMRPLGALGERKFPAFADNLRHRATNAVQQTASWQVE